MTTNTTAEGRSSSQKVEVPRNYEVTAWRFMRYSGILLIPLVWIHTILQDVIVGVHAIDLDYVAARWANTGWRVYSAALLGFAFAHGVNGLRQVLFDFFHTPRSRRNLSWALLLFWLVVTAIGAAAIIGGVRTE
jgi:succinate dehydrogenase / fumarate reductase, membrane anchor subunit